jgi:hypothetical protein
LNGKLLGDGSEPLWKILEVEFETCEIPFDACEIETFDAWLVLLEMKDVAAMPVDEVRDCGVEAFYDPGTVVRGWRCSSKVNPSNRRTFYFTSWRIV